MKKWLIPVVLFSLEGGTFALDFSIGIRGAAGVIPDYCSAVYGTQVSERSSKLGFSSDVGIFAVMGIVPWLALQSELNAVFVFVPGPTSNNSSEAFKSSLLWQSLEIPILVKFSIPANRMKFSFFAGTNFNFPLGKITSTITREIDGKDKTNTDKEKFSAENRFLFGWLCGIAINFLFTNKFEFGADLRYVASTQKIQYEASSGKILDLTDNRVQRLLLSLTAGWRF